MRHLCMNTQPQVRVCCKKKIEDAGCYHVLQLHAEPSVALKEKVESDSIIRDPDRVLTGTSMNHKIAHHGTNQILYQLDQQTTAMTNWDVVLSWFPIMSVERLKRQQSRLRGRVLVHRKTRVGNQTELVVQSSVYRLEAKFLDGKANSKMLCNMDSVDMRAPEDRAELTDHPASWSSVQQLNIQEQLIQGRSVWPEDRSSTAAKKPIRS